MEAKHSYPAYGRVGASDELNVARVEVALLREALAEAVALATGTRRAGAQETVQLVGCRHWDADDAPLTTCDAAGGGTALDGGAAAVDGGGAALSGSRLDGGSRVLRSTAARSAVTRSTTVRSAATRSTTARSAAVRSVARSTAARSAAARSVAVPRPTVVRSVSSAAATACLAPPMAAC